MPSPIARVRALRLLAAPSLVAFGRPAGAQGAPIRIGASSTEAFGEPFYVADAGIAARLGVNVEIVMFTSGGAMVSAVMGGSLDAGLSDMLQLANAVNHELPLAFFAGSSLYRSEAPLTVLCVAKNNPIRSAKELEGLPIGVNGLRTMAEISSRELLRQNGADPAKLRYVEIPPALAVQALARGTVAAAVVGEPFISSFADEIRVFLKPYDAVAKQFYISSWFAKRDWLGQNVAAARRFRQAIYDTARWANTHHDETAPILGKYLKVDPAAVRGTTRAVFATTLDTKLMQPVLDIGTRYGVLDREVEAATLIARLD